jgi:hypothetical protein
MPACCYFQPCFGRLLSLSTSRWICVDVICAVAADDADTSVSDTIDAFNATLAQWYPAFDPQAAFPTYPAIANAFPVIPSLASRTVKFASETALRNYVKSLDYTEEGYPEVTACPHSLSPTAVSQLTVADVSWKFRPCFRRLLLLERSASSSFVVVFALWYQLEAAIVFMKGTPGSASDWEYKIRAFGHFSWCCCFTPPSRRVRTRRRE